MQVMTVTGPISPEDLGVTLTHEHLLCNRKWVTGNQDHVVEDERLAIGELAEFAALGGKTLIELTVPDFGRDPEALKRISLATGVQIVMGAGWYHERYYPDTVDRLSTAALAEQLISEFADGAGQTGIRPGIIGEIGSGEKTAGSGDSERWVSAQEERVLRACARAQKQLGCPISTHAFASRIGEQQLDLLLEEGVNPALIVIGHTDSVADPEYHDRLAARGAWVQFDLFRNRTEWDVQIKLELIGEFVRRGYADQLLFSQDVCMRSHLKAYGGDGYTGIFDRYRARMIEAGLGEELFDRVMSVNPARLFAG